MDATKRVPPEEKMDSTTYLPTRRNEKNKKILGFADCVSINQSAPLQQWEYHIFEVRGIHADEDQKERVEELNKLGANGWEPAGTIAGGSHFHEYLILKRPKSSDAPSSKTIISQFDK